VTFLRLLLFFSILFFPSLSFLEARDPSIELLMFASHPEAETSGCGGTILKSLKFGKKINIVFLTNGNADRLKDQDAVFLGYPENRLFEIWDEADDVLGKSGTSRGGIIKDIKSIIKQARPGIICLPSPLSGNSDDRAAANFVNKALDDLIREEKTSGEYSPRLKYYILSSRAGRPYLEDYRKDGEEQFNEVSLQKDEYLKSLSKEWKWVAGLMKSYGYNLNMGVVAEVAENINDRGIYLAWQERIFSDDPDVVLELTGKIVEAMDSEGVIPVVKHFPGLGSVRENTHKWLPRSGVSKEELYEKDIFPFRGLIRANRNFWIMISHAIYPSLDDKPASLSYKIQTGILRKELGFKGIIISDELLGMQAVEEYAISRGFSKPCLGEIAAMAFEAGTDLALIYPGDGKEEEAIFQVLTAVKKALAEGRIPEKEIDESVSRILKEKERIFGKPLIGLIKTMSLEEKICQKIIIDVKSDLPAVNRYGLSGVEARNYEVIGKLQEGARIPLFIAGQHEGGRVSETALNIQTPSAYLTGREFERTLGRKSPGPLVRKPAKDKPALESFSPEPLFDFSQLNDRAKTAIVNILLNAIDEYIGFYRKLEKEPLLLSDPGFRGPLAINMAKQGRITLRPFDDLPVVWLREFPDKNTAICAYRKLKEAFGEWELAKANRALSAQNFLVAPGRMITMLESLKVLIRETRDKFRKTRLRVFCLAAHPDDEDAEALAFFKEKFGAETYILLATRGQAGENEAGAQLYEELGFLRTEEIERAAQILKVDKVYYLGKEDFGYCLDPEEAFSKWGKEDTLRRLVYFYRLIKPDVIITRHNQSNGHCNHRAMAILGQEAFDLSGDPRAYPEMFEDGLTAWQPARFYQRKNYKNEDYPLEELLIDTQEQAVLWGKTYARVAAEALSQHQSQGISGESVISGQLVYELAKFRKTGGLERPVQLNKVSPSGFPGVKAINGLKLALFEERSNTLFVALKALGCDFQKIDLGFIAEGDLTGFDTILLGKGLREISGSNGKAGKHLMEFVEKGGSLVVILQDRTAGVFSLAPYPLKIVSDPVFDENAPVKIIVPGHPLFNFPNKISVDDFSGWKQDRGLFFPSEYPEQYVELVALAGRDSRLNKSGYLAADYGKGRYILTTYAWGRQLREFNPGAYKNLANMLAYSNLKADIPPK